MAELSDDEFVIEPKIEYLDDAPAILGETLEGSSVPSAEKASAQFRWVLQWLKDNKLFKSFDALLEEYEGVLDKQIAQEVRDS